MPSFGGGLAARWAVGRTRAGSIVLPMLVVIVFGATFRTGIARGMDQMVAWEGWGRVVTAIAIVFTEQKYGEAGYAVSNCLFNELVNRGFTADPELVAKAGAKAPDNLKSGVFLDGILQPLWRDLRTLPDCRGGFRGFGADDLGFVDFTKLAFGTFGVHIRSFYYMFFLLYGISLSLVLVERRHDRLGQGVVLVVAAIVYAACFYSNLFVPEPPGLGNMLNPRFMSVLGFVPMVHLVLMTIDGVAVTVSRVGVVLFQAALVFLAIHTRASGAWLLAGLAIAVLVTLPTDLRPTRPVADALRRVLRGRWPAIAGVVLVLAGVQAVGLSLNRVYRQDGWLQHHVFWHSVYYSLMFHPQYLQRFDDMHHHARGDAQPVAAALAYLRAHPAEDSAAHYFQGSTSLKYAAMEKFVRRAFIDFTRRHPRFVFETFFVVKPGLMWAVIQGVTRRTWQTAPAGYRLLFVLGLLALGASANAAALRRLRWLVSIVGLAALSSLAIPFLTIPSPWTMSEMIMAWQFAVALLLSLSAALVAHRLGRGARAAHGLAPDTTEAP